MKTNSTGKSVVHVLSIVALVVGIALKLYTLANSRPETFLLQSLDLLALLSSVLVLMILAMYYDKAERGAQ